SRRAVPYGDRAKAEALVWIAEPHARTSVSSWCRVSSIFRRQDRIDSTWRTEVRISLRRITKAIGWHQRLGTYCGVPAQLTAVVIHRPPNSVGAFLRGCAQRPGRDYRCAFPT